MKWENAYVFISSTFNDMHAERDFLVKRVFPDLRLWCQERKIKLIDIDLRWGVSEDDATENKTYYYVHGAKRAFDKGEIDKICLVYNKFVNSMVQTPVIEQLLPLPRDTANQADKDYYWDYLYEPDAKSILDQVFKRYIESLVYQGVVENLASELAARMVAMKAATENADELVKDLQIVYNKARQAGITQELPEIVSGAAAV